MRPVIGITTYVEPATWGVWHDLATALVPHDYVAAVTGAGGGPCCSRPTISMPT
ncbi:hypothetical protein Asp14428_62480 [Actinoplanes sp. NBRC 14428]|nr:hypothetical protein Asp14428_62480 [Actinoplanes sp. NBRC 14428]